MLRGVFRKDSMTDIIDIHTHTIASMHAYSTIREMAAAAKEKGLALIGISDHAPGLPGTFPEMYFRNFKVIRPAAYGIDIIMGAELNIMNYEGKVDLPEKTLQKLHYAIASLHDLTIRPGTQEENTRALIHAMENPYVGIIGHPDNPAYPIDFDALARAAAEHHVLIEANSASHNPNGPRKGSELLARSLLDACRRHGAHIIIGSDAHVDSDVGEHSHTHAILEEIDFPAELVLNSDPARLKAWIAQRHARGGVHGLNYSS